MNVEESPSSPPANAFILDDDEDLNLDIRTESNPSRKDTKTPSTLDVSPVTSNQPKVHDPVKEDIVSQEDKSSPRILRNKEEAKKPETTSSEVRKWWDFNPLDALNVIGTVISDAPQEKGKDEFVDSLKSFNGVVTSVVDDAINLVKATREQQPGVDRKLAQNPLVKPAGHSNASSSGNDPADIFVKACPHIGEDHLISNYQCAILQRYKCFHNSLTPICEFTIYGILFITMSELVFWADNVPSNFGMETFKTELAYEKLEEVEMSVSEIHIKFGDEMMLLSSFNSDRNLKTALGTLQRLMKISKQTEGAVSQEDSSAAEL